MARVAYSATKNNFIRDVQLNSFIGKMREGASLNHIGSSESEIRSWQNNAPFIRSLLELSDIPDDVIVSFEYKVPNGGRIDCMLYGKDCDDIDNVIHIELKQWNNNSVEEMYDNGVFMVNAFTGGDYRVVCHPSQQVANYQMHLLNYVNELNSTNTHLNGYAYCYNYSSTATPNALYAKHYRTILDQNRLFSGDEVEEFARKIHLLLSKGSGLEIFNRVTHSKIQQSKTLLEAAANMFRGITEFTLLDDQIAASETIFAEVEKASKKDEKTVIIVKGGPGTGKTVIALHILAQMAQQKNNLNIFYTTRSKALRESLKARLRSVKLENGQCANASDMIANIFSFKPYNYKEGDVGLLLVDEAHRVQKSANYMNDSFLEETYLSQLMSLMYCTRVCVFFIDDKQAVNGKEIGNSIDIKETAEHYKEKVGDFKDSVFYEDLLKTEKSLSKNEARLQLIKDSTDEDSLKEKHTLNEKIEKQRYILTKKDCLSNVHSTLKKDIKVLEFELKSQFRCNGSDNYLDWLDDTLYRSGNEVRSNFKDDEYQFGVFGSPQELYEKICSLNHPESSPVQVARIAAGYCWRWSTSLTEDGDLKKDVVIGDWKMPWETNNVRARGRYLQKYASSADTWAIEPEGINQVGCIFSIQGFEIDYIGVILGPDITYDKEHDCLVGVLGKNVDIKTSNQEQFTQLVKNAYRVLMSRGTKGCFIYSTDPEVSAFIERCHNVQSAPQTSVGIVSIEDWNDRNDKDNLLPLFTMRAACGYFDESEYPEPEGWVDASGHGFKPDAKKYFVVHAKGDSMLPKIHDGDLCIFEWYNGGSRNGEIVLTQCEDDDPEYSGRYTIKKYESEKSYTENSWAHTKVRLIPLNTKDYHPIDLSDDDKVYKTIGILKAVIGSTKVGFVQ